MRKELITVYKVLWEAEHGLCSYATRGPNMITYKLGKVNRHQNMFVYESLSAALSNSSPPHQVWRCFTEAVYPAPERIVVATPLGSQFHTFWLNPAGYARHHITQGTPWGTVLCHDLRLIERVR